MVMLAGAVSSDTRRSSRTVAESIARATASNDCLRERLLYEKGGITLFAVERHEHKPVIEPRRPHSAGTRRWVLGDVNYYARAPSSETRIETGTLSDLWSSKIPGRWLGIEVDPATGVVRFSTDKLGLAWLYIARTTSGYVFSSDFAAVAGAVGSALSIDRDTALLELALSYAPDERTVFNEISLLPPGAIVELSDSGMNVIASAPVRYGDRFAGLSTDRKYERLDEIYDAIVGNTAKTLAPDLVVSISAGYDSRYALAFLEKHDIKAKLCTFGARESDEVRGAMSVCGKVGRSTSVFSVAASHWIQWRRAIQQLGNTGMIQWSGWAESWLEFLSRHGRYAVIGYLGDALTGKHLGKTERGDADWLRFWAQWSTEGGWADSPLLTASARKRLRECLPQRLEQAIEKASTTLPHQRALHLDLYGRQRRWVAAQPNLMSRFLTPYLFFYDDDLMDFWTNLPAEDMLQQKLYLSYAQNRFPRLFPRGEGQPPTVIERAIRKAVRMTGAAAMRRPRQPNPRVIDHDAIIVPNRQRILDLVDRVSPLAGELIDVVAFREQVRLYGQSSNLPSLQIMKAVNLFLLLDLCA
jgi:hypothetical protein